MFGVSKFKSNSGARSLHLRNAGGQGSVTTRPRRSSNTGYDALPMLYFHCVTVVVLVEMSFLSQLTVI